VTFVEEASYVGRLNLIDLKFKDGLKIIQIFFSPNELDILFLGQGIIGGKYHCTVDLLFDWFGLVCFANKNKNCDLSYS
jgi:hypothetical protein